MKGEVVSIREAARRVNRSRRTIQRWLADPEPLPFHQRPGDSTKWIHLEDLQATFVRKLRASPTRHPNPANAKHGTRGRYQKGCTAGEDGTACAPCRAAVAAYERNRYWARVDARNARRARDERNFLALDVTP